MRHIDNYAAGSTQSFDELLIYYQQPARNILETISPRIAQATTQFQNIVPNLEILNPIIFSKLEKETLISAYNDRPAGVRNAFMLMEESLAPIDRGLCPFCNLGEDCELDHYLPKNRFPEFSLFSSNLVPICPKCNKHKSSVVKNKYGQRVVLYPFADLQQAPRFLRANILLALAPRTEFEIFNPGTLSDETFELIGRHFARLHLARRLEKRADNALSALITNLRGRSETTVRDSIAITAQNLRLANPTNYWEVALYDGLEQVIDEFVEFAI